MIRTQSALRLPSEALKKGGISEESNSELNDQLKLLQIELSKVITKPSNFFDDSIVAFRNTCTLTTRVSPFILTIQQDACEFMVELLKIEPFYQDANFIQVDKHYKEGTSVIEKSIQEQADVFTRGSREFPDEEGNKLNHSNNAFLLTRVTNFSLPIPRKFNISEKQVTGSLNECFDSYFTPELMELASDNPKHGYLKQLSVYKWPKLLVICLSRFGGTTTENPSYNPDNPKKFPRYLFKPSKNGTPIDVPLHFIRDDQCYRLHGIVTHHGESIEKGHYTAYVYSKVEDRWYHYNDNNVSVHNNYNDFKDQINNDQYILVYEKIAQEECGLVVGTPRPTDPISGKPSFPPKPPPQVPSTTAEVEFCRDPIVSDPVPSTALALPEIPWDRNLPNPNIGDSGLANDCWFNSVFQIMVRTPIAHQIVTSPEVYSSNPVLQSIKDELVKLFTKSNYFVVRGKLGCSIFRSEFEKHDNKPINKIGSPQSDEYFLTQLIQVEPFRSQTKYELALGFVIPDHFSPYYDNNEEGVITLLNTADYLNNNFFDSFPNIYILKLDADETYFTNVPSTFVMNKTQKYVLFGFTIQIGGHFRSAVHNRVNGRWYLYDDRTNSTPQNCSNWESYDDDLTDTKIISFRSLEDLTHCTESSIFTQASSISEDMVDGRKTLVYLKDPQDPLPAALTTGAVALDEADPYELWGAISVG